jgi:two-component system sensor histidine kinase/response regulator
MSRPPLEVADLIRSAGAAFIERNRQWIRRKHVKVLPAIARCRTAALGGHVDQCTRCGHRATISYNSCRNRHCPKCQTAARDRWIAARQKELLPTRYVHVVFTLPAPLARLAVQNIRAPLNGVIGMTDLALDTALTSEQREYLETVKLSADSLLTVINDILDFSKVEAGKLELEFRDFNLRDCLETTLKTLANRADEKGLELLCEIAPEIPEVACGDSTRLRQIVLNLVGNAIKFTHVGEVALKLELESTEGDTSSIHFIVSDTGIGIPLDKQRSIFDPFSQVDTSTTRKYGGTGLGLTISARFVALMGGRIWVQSEPSQGSQFHFTIPLKTSQEKVEIGAPAPPELLRGVKALIVDDNRTNQRILQGMLTRWEMKATAVEGGAEALAALEAARDKREPYGLILTDMHMPNMDGFTLIERIRQQPGLSTAVIVMLTSAGHRGDADRCKQLGVSAYLLKPIRQTELREAIARVLGRVNSGALFR